MKPSHAHEADQPDLVFDFTDTHWLAGEHSTEVSVALADADAAPAGDPHQFVADPGRTLGRVFFLDSQEGTVDLER